MGGSFLQSAVFIFGTVGAIEVMMAEKKLESGISQSFNFGCIEMYYYAIADRLGAGSNGGASTFNFHKAKATRSKGCAGFSYGT